MIFSSVTFLFFFLPLALLVYFLPLNRWRNGTFLALSLLFYVWGEGWHVYVLLLSTMVNYLLGMGLDRAGRSKGPSDGQADRPGPPLDRATASKRKAIVALGIAFNIGILFFYKYTGFLITSINGLLDWARIEPLPSPEIHVPLGVSFFTFHAISYLVDLYRQGGGIQAGPMQFGLYMTAFPKLLAGPIAQYRDARKDLAGRREHASIFLQGIERFIVGLGKKILIANPLAALVDRIFSIPAGELGFQIAWLGAICFTLQIYFDFSGYSDMAIGLGKMFGFNFPENFNYPYISQSVREFWRRWHISLSHWFRDYLYIPLGGNRCPPSRIYLNIITVFLLCGFWHGASWNFIVWGIWYGIFLVLERTGFGHVIDTTWRPVRHFYALAVIVIGWVFFRADTLSYALAYLGVMFGFAGLAVHDAHLLTYVTREILLAAIIGAVASTPWLRKLRDMGKTAGGADRGIAGPCAFSLYAVLLGGLFFLSCISLAGGTHKAFIYLKF